MNTSSERPAVACAIEEITPETAKQWLGLNHVNRRLADPIVNRITGIIERGEWMEDCTDGIGLDVDGGVINGQHRLNAIMNSGRTVRALVVRNVRPEVIKIIDQGRGRTFVQWLQMQGNIAQPNVVGPAVEWLHRMNHGLEIALPTANKPTIPQLLELFTDHPQIVFSVDPAHEAFRGLGGPPKSMLTAYHYTFASVDAELADEFFTGLASGVDLPENSPTYVLRERLHKELKKDSANRVRNYVMCAWLVKAWEAARDGVEVNERQLMWKSAGRGGQPFPKVSEVPWDVIDSAIEPDDDDQSADFGDDLA